MTEVTRAIHGRYQRLVTVRAAALDGDHELLMLVGDSTVAHRLARPQGRWELVALERLGVAPGTELTVEEVREAFSHEVRLVGGDPDLPETVPVDLREALENALAYVRRVERRRGGEREEARSRR